MGVAGVDHPGNDERDLVFEGLLLFSDPPKADIDDARGAAELGVDLRIVTGDNDLVARAVAGRSA